MLERIQASRHRMERVFLKDVARNIKLLQLTADWIHFRSLDTNFDTFCIWTNLKLLSMEQKSIHSAVAFPSSVV